MSTYTDPQAVCQEKEPEFIPLWIRYGKIFERLSNEALGELLKGMLTYAQSGQEPELKSEGYFLWPVIRQDMDYSRKSYEEKVAAGRRSGEARRAKKKQTEEAPPEQMEAGDTSQQTGTTPEQKGTDPEQTGTDPEQMGTTPEQKGVNHNHNQTQKQKHNQNQPQPQPQKETHGISQEVAEEVGEKETSEFALGKMVLSKFYEIRDDLARPEYITRQTLQKAQELGRKYPSAAIQSVFQKSRRGFLNGEGEKGWSASLGWLLDEEHFQAVLEGKYDWSQKEVPAVSPPKKKTTMAQEQTRRVEMGSAGLGEYERQAIQRMLAENGIC